MRAKTQTLNEQIRLLMNDFTGQAVNLYGQLGPQPVCNAASQAALRRVGSAPLPARQSRASSGAGSPSSGRSGSG